MDTLAVRKLTNPTEHGVQISLSAPNNRRLLARFANQRLSKPAPFTAERSSLSPLQLIAKASSAALELTETGDLEPALKVLSQLAKIWK